MNVIIKFFKVIIILLCCSPMIAQQATSTEVIIGTSFIQWPNLSFTPNSSSYRDMYLRGQVNKSVYKGIFISSGLGIRRQRFRTEINFAKWESEIQGNDPFDSPGSLHDDIIEDTRHWFIDVPILLRYQFTKGKITPFAESGIISSYYLRSKSDLKLDDQSEPTYKGKYRGIQNFHFVTTASLGVSYAISNHFSITLRGRFFRQLKSTNELTAIDPYYGYGINAGVMFFPF